MTKRQLSHNALIACLCSAMALGACTAPVDRPLTVDGTRNAQFNDDYAACHSQAATYNDSTVKETAAAGAVLGGIVTGIEETTVESVALGAAVGGLIGSADGAYELDKTRRDVLIRCMQNRGHSVIG